MNTKQLLAAALLVATGSAFAQQPEYVAPDATFVSTKTRAEVKTELELARTEGVYVAGGEQYPGQFALVAKSNRGRADRLESARNSQSTSKVAGS
ncbi:DUF4148 domain-containing protein [Noviherbaspirillum massiliense]|uniref:DUF4148 domain-containing protein n=1 Tax=Noviherbaspirillum massiliense TaxID=1465823 RepID=UPI0002E910BB|nr:DUF4148 domain-containing protein [Noviherbaspirillum massiliense]